MTAMLHRLPDATPFDIRRQVGDLSSIVPSEEGSRYLADGYTGWPQLGLWADPAFLVPVVEALAAVAGLGCSG